MKNIYIRATGNISPQKTFGQVPFLHEPIKTAGYRLYCIEPDYKSIIDVRLIRRMSRIIKMGVAAAMECLREAGIKMPGAIITGTAYGCLEDTGSFLQKMVEQEEEMLTPTAFIQSTHNTIGAQIALILQCHNYNNTFVHRGFSFESALLDSIMLLKEGEADDVLVGGMDEITDISHTILSRFGLYKEAKAGEGAAFFLLTAQSSGNDYARLDAITTFYKPGDIRETEERILGFLTAASVSIRDVDVVITGRSGDVTQDEVYKKLQQSVFKDSELINYKDLCGEYPTSIAFALWLGAGIIKAGKAKHSFPYPMVAKKKPERILIYNHYQNLHHSLLLISA